MFAKILLSTVAAVALLAASASAICPGYKFGVSQPSNNGPWQVFDNNCNIVQQAPAKNACGNGVFDCNSAQNAPTALHLDGHKYACSADPNHDSCNGQSIQVCTVLPERTEDDRVMDNIIVAVLTFKQRGSDPTIISFAYTPRFGMTRPSVVHLPATMVKSGSFCMAASSHIGWFAVLSGVSKG
ncbi:hypothetical protein EDD15DRAFT_2521300 [Pisolithus albus]|nr:hypothetical protein EDD15DRAFT_2521300 [Pisolithus albus]